jgi:hypothetical protein
MKTVTKYAEAFALAGVLALAALTYSFAQLHTDGVSQLSQYCAPQDDGWATQKIYCRAEPS